MSRIAGRAIHCNSMAGRAATAAQGFGSQFNKFLNDQTSPAQWNHWDYADSDPFYDQTRGAGMFYDLNTSINDWFSGLFKKDGSYLDLILWFFPSFNEQQEKMSVAA